MSQFTNKANKVKENVKLLCNAEPAVKANYNLLVLRYWIKFDGLKSVSDFAHVLGCTSAEGICRSFRKLVENGEIAVDENTREKRDKQQEEYESHYGKPRQSYIDFTEQP